jgi:hypothetical protein
VHDFLWATFLKQPRVELSHMPLDCVVRIVENPDLGQRQPKTKRVSELINHG